MSGVRDYPDHLNPFDENYGVVESTREKYHTWSSTRSNQVNTVSKVKPTSLEKQWTVLNISPKNKIVRRLSILKTAVERFASKKTRLSHSASLKEGNTTIRSHSLHDEFAFRIISPKIKEKIRQQAFSKAIDQQKDVEAESSDAPETPQPNGRLDLPLKTEEDSLKLQDDGNLSPQDLSPAVDKPLGARPKTRKKRPPPPPPVTTDPSKPVDLVLSNSQDGPEDSQSINSSITHELEKDLSSEDDNSLTDLHEQNVKTN